MAVLSNQEFLSKANDLLAKTNGSSSVYLTQKRMSYTPNATSIPVEPTDDTIVPVDENTYQVLIRLTDGNKNKKSKVKLSTLVDCADLDSFWSEYSNVLKNGFIGLKKKDKKKKSKSTKNKKKGI